MLIEIPVPLRTFAMVERIHSDLPWLHMTTPTPSAVRPVRPWRGLSPTMAPSLADSRRQLHHAVQLATAVGISWLPAQADDSHTNLEWVHHLGGVFCGVVPVTEPFRVGLRVEPLGLVVVDERTAQTEVFPLHGQRVTEAGQWLRERGGAHGADVSRFTLDRHYVIPHHPVADGAPFDAAPRAAFAELAAWLDNGDATLRRIAEASPSASDVRLWPHHLDIATLMSMSGGNSIGVGLELGDDYYAEPYFYVNVHPSPTAAEAARLRLAGSGQWHTDGWIGAVLPASRLTTVAADQPNQVSAFADSALAAAHRLVGG